jgi:hypothetical protein
MLNLPLDAHQLLFSLENLKKNTLITRALFPCGFFFLQSVVSFLLLWKKYLTYTKLLKAWTHVM